MVLLFPAALFLCITVRYFAAACSNVLPPEGGPTKQAAVPNASSVLDVITNGNSWERIQDNKKQTPWEGNTCAHLEAKDSGVQLCISSEGRLTMEPSFPSLFATKRRVISFWLTGPEDQKTTGNLNVSLGHNHSPHHGNTSGNEAFGADQLRFRPRGRSKTCQDLEE